MTLMGYISFNASKSELLKRISEKLHLINDLKRDKIEDYFSKIQSSFEFIDKSKDLKFILEDYIITHQSTHQDSIVSIDPIYFNLLHENLKTLKESYKFNRIMVVTLKGEKIYETNSVSYLKQQDQDLFSLDNSYFIEARTGVVFTDIFRPQFRNDEYYITAMAPIKNANNKAVGILACEISATPLFNILTDSTGLGTTGESYITQKVQNKIKYLSPLKYKKQNVLEFSVKLGEPYSEPAQKSSKKEAGFATEVLDYDKTLVDAAWSYIPGINWGIVTKINHEDSFKSILYLRVLVTFLCFSIIFFSIIFVSIFVKKFLRPIIDIRDNMINLSKGNFPEEVYYENVDEIKETTQAMNNLVTRLKHSTEFSQRIGQGDLNAPFDYDKGEDVLSRSLVSMRDSLVNIERENEKRKWVTEGLALHAEIIRKNNESLKATCQAFISNLVKYLGIQHGGVYVINRIQEKGLDLGSYETEFDLMATFGFDLSEDSGAITTFKLGQGLVGQCALEKELIYIKDHPIDSIKIKSGLGEAPALHIIFAPLLVNQEIYGVLELAAFDELEDYKLDFIEKVTEGIASAVLSAKTSEHTIMLLQESRNITETLRKKEVELKDQQKDLQSKIDELKKENGQSHEIIKRLEDELNKLKK